MKSAQAIHTPYFRSILRPSRLRYYAFRILVMLAAYEVGFTLYQNLSDHPYTSQIWLFNTITFMAVYTLALIASTRSFDRDLTVTIHKGVIQGPTGSGLKRISFPLHTLDKARTGRTSWMNWVFLYRHIWSQDGQKITLFLYAFDPVQVDALIEQLGC